MLFGLGKAPEDALVFASFDGSPRSPNGLTKQWQLAMRQLGLRATLHSLRHSHASTLIASGLDIWFTLAQARAWFAVGHLEYLWTFVSKSDDRAAQIIEAALTGVSP